MRKIEKIIVHCTATPQGKNFSVADIDRWHRQRGFQSIGYHFVIGLDGEVFVGRPIEQVGAHCKNQNARSIGVCYVGGLTADGKKPTDSRTPQQKAALVSLLTELRKRFPQAKIYGHRDFANKACPCFDATQEYANL